jgi:hypothetical protein
MKSIRYIDAIILLLPFERSTMHMFELLIIGRKELE